MIVDFLVYVSKESYTVSLEGVQKIFDTVKQSIVGLSVYIKDFNYERIDIKFQQADGKESICG